MPKPETNGMERRFLASPKCNLQLRGETGGQIVGYGAVFYDGTTATEFRLWDDMVERIMPGAFDRAVREDDVRGLFNHDPNLLLGRTASKTMRLSVDATGLKYEIDPPDTQVGRDVTGMLRRGDLTGSSFSFVTTDEEWRKENGTHIREVRGVQLFDTGPVTFPAYTGTSADVRDEFSVVRSKYTVLQACEGAGRRFGAIQAAAWVAADEAAAAAGLILKARAQEILADCC